MSMLAASVGSSNVAPDYVKPAPVTVLAAAAPDQFVDYGAVVRDEPEPADATQQDTAVCQLGRPPLAAAAPDLDVTVRRETDALAAAPALPQHDKLAAAECSPEDQCRQACPGWGRHQCDGESSGEHHRDAGREHDGAQLTVRVYFGGVCGR